MKEITLEDGGILSMGGNPNVLTEGNAKSGVPSWARRLIRGVINGLAAPFQSDWEEKTGLEWKEWAKLRS